MLRTVRNSILPVSLALAGILFAPSPPAFALSGAELREDAAAALAHLYKTRPEAKELGAKAKAILIFPNIVKAGFIVGGSYGEGVLQKGGQSVGYYSSVAASYGFQAGAQAFGYALFLMNDSALHYLDKSEGWEIGVGPSIVIVNEGVAKNLTSTTLQNDIYAFVFDQKGLMAGIGIQGTKVTKIDK
ncbi:MAG: YSC84-related protein [Candidatus Binatia bacterium]